MALLRRGPCQHPLPLTYAVCLNRPSHSKWTAVWLFRSFTLLLLPRLFWWQLTVRPLLACWSLAGSARTLAPCSANVFWLHLRLILHLQKYLIADCKPPANLAWLRDWNHSRQQSEFYLCQVSLDLIMKHCWHLSFPKFDRISLGWENYFLIWCLTSSLYRP